MMNTDDHVARLARVRDADLAGARNRPAAAALLEQVTAAAPETRPRPWRRSVRWPTALGVAAAGLAVTVAVGGLMGESDSGRVVRSPDGSTIRYINAALNIERSGHVYTVQIKDAYADPDKYAQEFRRAGLKVDLRLVPASPSVVHNLLAVSVGDAPEGSGDEGATSVYADPEHCPSGGADCPLGLRISTDNPDLPIEVRVGRKAKPGERYDETARGDATKRGEVLHGEHVEGRSLRDVRLLLQQRRLTVAGYLRGEVFGGGAGSSMGPVSASEVRPDEPVAEVQAASDHSVIVIVGRIPHPHG